MTTTVKPQPKKEKQKERVDYAKIVTNKIIALLEKGTMPWRKPWNAKYGLARNYASGHVYQGINMFILNLLPEYEIPLYMSRKQIKEKGGKIRKGAKATWTYFYGVSYKDADGKTIKASEAEKREDVKVIKFLKTRPVFNVHWVEGIEIELTEVKVKNNSPIESCESFLASLCPPPEYFATDTDCACYDLVKDNIRIPDMKYFEQSEEYYCTLFHEIIHWTGGKTRLARTGIISKEASFGTKLYAEEELVAELGASFLCHHTGIAMESITENNAAYIQGWLKRLKDDKNMIFRTSAKAQQALSFLMPFTEIKNE